MEATSKSGVAPQVSASREIRTPDELLTLALMLDWACHHNGIVAVTRKTRPVRRRSTARARQSFVSIYTLLWLVKTPARTSLTSLLNSAQLQLLVPTVRSPLRTSGHPPTRVQHGIRHIIHSEVSRSLRPTPRSTAVPALSTTTRPR